jgi:hypothetical protein
MHRLLVSLVPIHHPQTRVQILRVQNQSLSLKVCRIFLHKNIEVLFNIDLLLGLSSWREAVQRSVTAAQLSMALYTLEQCVAWDKSIMKAVRLKYLWTSYASC